MFPAVGLLSLKGYMHFLSVLAFSILIDSKNDDTVCTWGNVFLNIDFPGPTPDLSVQFLEVAFENLYLI